MWNEKGKRQEWVDDIWREESGGMEGGKDERRKEKERKKKKVSVLITIKPLTQTDNENKSLQGIVNGCS